MADSATWLSMLSQERNLVTELRSGRLRWTDQPGDDYGSRSPEVRVLGWLLGLSETRATTRLVEPGVSTKGQS